MDIKGIFNIELLVSLMILLIIFVMLSSISFNEFSSLEENQNRKEARRISSDVTRIIDEVYINGDNYSRYYTLPEKINNETYILEINHSGIYINSHYQMTYSNVLPGIEYNFKKIFLERGNTYEFINNNQTIIIKQKF